MEDADKRDRREKESAVQREPGPDQDQSGK